MPALQTLLDTFRNNAITVREKIAYLERVA